MNKPSDILWAGIGTLFVLFLLSPLALVVLFAFTSRPQSAFPIEALSLRWWQAMRHTSVLAGHAFADDFGEAWRALEWMGLQRHLKVLGIFCRLKHRDGKPKYSEDLPRFFNYAHKVASRYGTLRPLCLLLEPLMGTTRDEAFY